MTLAIFKESGTSPVIGRDKLNRYNKGPTVPVAISFNSLGPILSGPGDFFIVKSINDLENLSVSYR